MGQCVIGVERKGFLVAGDGVIELALLGQFDTLVVEGHRVIGFVLACRRGGQDKQGEQHDGSYASSCDPPANGMHGIAPSLAGAARGRKRG